MKKAKFEYNGLKFYTNFNPEIIFKISDVDHIYHKQYLSKIKERIHFDLYDCKSNKEKYQFISETLMWLDEIIRYDRVPNLTIEKAIDKIKSFVDKGKTLPQKREDLAKVIFKELFDDDNPNIPFIEFIESLDFEDLNFIDYEESFRNLGIKSRYVTISNLNIKIRLWLINDIQKYSEYNVLSSDDERISTGQDNKTVLKYFKELLKSNRDKIQIVSERKLNTLLYKYFEGFSKPDELDNDKIKKTISKSAIAKLFHDFYNHHDLKKHPLKLDRYAELLNKEFECFENDTIEVIKNKFSTHNPKYYPFNTEKGDIYRE